MGKYRIFISSVLHEFKEERRLLSEYINQDPLLGNYYIPVKFEDFPAMTLSANEAYLKGVKEADIYLGMLGVEYGNTDLEGVSHTEREYDCAFQHGKERWIFIKGSRAQLRPDEQEIFIAKTEDDVTRNSFNNMADLEKKVFAACVNHLRKEDLIQDLPFDSDANKDARMGDIDEAKVQAFIKEARAKRGFPLREGESTDKVLTHLGLYQGAFLVNSALLLFGKDPQKFYPQAVVKCAKYPGVEKLRPMEDHKVFGGDVFEQVNKSVNFVLSYLKSSVGRREESVQAPLHYEIPNEVVREAIVNAVAHRNYNSSGSIHVDIYSDRLEITNPGGLAKELTIPMLFENHGSYPVNGKLADRMRENGYIETFGTGILQMLQTLRQFNLEDPEFKLHEGFKVILWRPNKKRSSTDQAPIKYRSSTAQVPQKHRSSEIIQVIQVIVGEMKSSEIMSAVGMKHQKTFRDNYLNPCIDAGLIEMTHPDHQKHPKQRYFLSTEGLELKEELNKN